MNDRPLLWFATGVGVVAIAPVLFATAVESRGAHHPCISLVFSAIAFGGVVLGAWSGGRLSRSTSWKRFAAALGAGVVVWALMALNWPALGLLSQRLCRM